MEYSQNNLQTHNQRLKNIFKAIIFLFIFGTVSACGSNFLYNLIDNMLVRSMNKYFDLNKDQKRFLKDRLEYKLNLHRTHGIPEHIAFIKDIQEKVQKELNKGSVKWFIQDLMRQVNLITNRFSDDLVEFLITLQPEQIDYFEEKLAEQDEKYIKNLQKSLDKQAENNPEKTMKSTIKSFEEWFGPLSDTQKKELLQLTKQMSDSSKQKDNSEQNYTERLERQQKFIKVLRREGRNREKVEKALHEIFNSLVVLPDDESIILITDFIIKIDQLITPKQRNHLIKRLDGWIDKLDNLIDT